MSVHTIDFAINHFMRERESYSIVILIIKPDKTPVGREQNHFIVYKISLDMIIANNISRSKTNS